MIDQILNEHAIEKIHVTENSIRVCPVCSCGIQWRAYESAPWRCLICCEPPSWALARFVRMIVYLADGPAWESVRPPAEREKEIEVGPIEFDEIPRPVYSCQQIADYIYWRHRGIDSARTGGHNHVTRGRKTRNTNQTGVDRK